MKKVGKIGLVLALIFVLAGCQTKEKEATKKAEPKVTQTKKKAKKTTQSSSSENKQATSASTAGQQATGAEQPAANQAAANPSVAANNQAGNPTNSSTPAQQQPGEPVPVETPNDIANVGVYSREECIHIARMTIMMSGADDTQFTEDQLYNYYDQCAQLGADYSYLLGLVAQDTGADKQALIERYHLVNGLNPDGTTPE